MAEKQGRWRDRGRGGRLGLAVVVLGSLAGAPAGAQTAGGDRGYATQPFTPQGFTLPAGSGCAGEVARWQAVQENDYASGNIGLPVYHQIQGEIARAAAACQAGHEAEASRLVHASKARHGYPG